MSAPSADQPAPARRGMPGSAKSMVISMVVVIAACLVWLAFTPRVRSVSQPVEDVPGIAREIGNSQHWDVAVPEGLSAQWQATNVQLLTFAGQPPTWQAGYTGPNSDYAAVLQTKNGTASWVQAQLTNATAQGTISIDGVSWTKYLSSVRGQKALVRTVPLSGLSTMVLTTGDWSLATTFARSLQPLSRAQGSTVAP